MLLSAGSPTHQHVIRATAPSLNGPWTFPSLKPLSFPCLSQKWMAAESGKHGAPSAWREGNTIKALIQGEDEVGRTALGLVWTEDEGETWNTLDEMA